MDKIVEEIIQIMGLRSSGRNSAEKLARTVFCVGARPQEFSTTVGGYPSLHTAFENFLVKKVSGIGVTVVGVDEWCTSQVQFLFNYLMYR